MAEGYPSFDEDSVAGVGMTCCRMVCPGWESFRSPRSTRHVALVAGDLLSRNHGGSGNKRPDRERVPDPGGPFAVAAEQTSGDLVSSTLVVTRAEPVSAVLLACGSDAPPTSRSQSQDVISGSELLF